MIYTELGVLLHFTRFCIRSWVRTMGVKGLGARRVKGLGARRVGASLTLVLAIRLATFSR